MNLNKFKLIHSYRNIVSKKGFSAIIVLSISLLMTLLILSFSMYSVLKQVFLAEARNAYGSVDIVITYDENSDVRLVNVRYLEEEYIDLMTSASVFLNLHSLFYANEQTIYADLLAGKGYEFERLAQTDISNLSSSECVITSSLSKKESLKIGDSITMSSSIGSFRYTIKQIVEDNSVFSGDKVFVLKDYLIEELYGLTNLDKIGNTIYIDLKSSVDISTFKNILFEDENYQSFQIFETVNHYEIERAARYDTILFFGISVLMLVALFFVLYSLFTLFFKDFPKDLGVLSSLGADDTYLFHVWGISLLIFLGISTFFSSILSLVLFNIGVSIYGVSTFITYPIWTIFLALFVTGLLLLCFYLFMKRKMRFSSSVNLSTTNQLQKLKPRWFLFLVLGIVIMILGILQPFSLGLNAIFITILSIIFLFSLFDVSLFFIRKIKKKKESLFHLYNFKTISDHPIHHQSFRVIFIIFLVVFAVISVRSFIRTETTVFNQQLNVDYALLGIQDYDNTLLTELTNDLEVEHVIESVVYQDTYLNFNDEVKRIRFAVSMEYSEFQEAFGMDTLEFNLTSVQQIHPVVLLPISLKYIYGVEVGDVIPIDFSSDLKGIPVEIVGFLDTPFDNLIFTNIYSLADSLGISINTVFINSSSETTFDDLITYYSPKMYYVLSMDDFVNDFSDYILRTNDLFLFLSTVLIACFMIVLVNNTLLIFSSLKSDYAKLWILGLSPKELRMTLLKEFGFLYFYIILFTSLESIVFEKYFPQMMLVFRYYKEIKLTISSLLITDLILGILLLATYFYYYFKVKRMTVILETKKY